MRGRSRRGLRPPQGKSGRKAISLYTKGELNRIVDSLLHPLCQENPSFILLDALMHSLIEQNPPETIQKFMRYSLPEIIKKLKR